MTIEILISTNLLTNKFVCDKSFHKLRQLSLIITTKIAIFTYNIYNLNTYFKLYLDTLNVLKIEIIQTLDLYVV